MIHKITARDLRPSPYSLEDQQAFFKAIAQTHRCYFDYEKIGHIEALAQLQQIKKAHRGKPYARHLNRQIKAASSLISEGK